MVNGRWKEAWLELVRNILEGEEMVCCKCEKYYIKTTHALKVRSSLKSKGSSKQPDPPRHPPPTNTHTSTSLLNPTWPKGSGSKISGHLMMTAMSTSPFPGRL